MQPNNAAVVSVVLSMLAVVISFKATLSAPEASHEVVYETVEVEVPVEVAADTDEAVPEALAEAAREARVVVRPAAIDDGKVQQIVRSTVDSAIAQERAGVDKRLDSIERQLEVDRLLAPLSSVAGDLDGADRDQANQLIGQLAEILGG